MKLQQNFSTIQKPQEKCFPAVKIIQSIASPRGILCSFTYKLLDIFACFAELVVLLEDAWGFVLIVYSPVTAGNIVLVHPRKPFFCRSFIDVSVAVCTYASPFCYKERNTCGKGFVPVISEPLLPLQHQQPWCRGFLCWECWDWSRIRRYYRKFQNQRHPRKTLYLRCMPIFLSLS